MKKNELNEHDVTAFMSVIRRVQIFKSMTIGQIEKVLPYLQLCLFEKALNALVVFLMDHTSFECLCMHHVQQGLPIQSSVPRSRRKDTRAGEPNTQ